MLAPPAPLSEADKPRLRELATLAAANSYSPYSRFRVGSALLLTDGTTVTGCEFGADEMRIVYPGEGGEPRETTLGALLPHAFRLELLDAR